MKNALKQIHSFNNAENLEFFLKNRGAYTAWKRLKDKICLMFKFIKKLSLRIRRRINLKVVGNEK
jgi:hypothetical protein